MKRKALIPIYKQLLAYAEAAEREGWYYGDKKQFRRRHVQIMRFLYEIIEICENPNEKEKS